MDKQDEKSEKQVIKLTTQEIYDKIQEIQKTGNWIESPFRQVVWVPFNKVCEIKNDGPICPECEGRGKLRANSCDFNKGGYKFGFTTCELCSGTGRISKKMADHMLDIIGDIFDEFGRICSDEREMGIIHEQFKENILKPCGDDEGTMVGDPQ